MAPGHAVKRRRLSPAENGAGVNDFFSRAAEWDLEQDYERRPRKGNKRDKEKSRLPIKTAEGAIEHVEEFAAVEDESDNPFDSDEDDVEVLDDTADVEVKEQPKPRVPPKVQIREAKEELARIAALINEEPEEHTGLFKTLADMVSQASISAVKKLALATQAAVYRDVIPGYRIRPLGDDDMSSKISKEVRKLRSFEQSLLSGYQNYVKQLATFAKPSNAGSNKEDDAEGLKLVAINCTCSLLTTVPHFNFRGELLKILIGQLGRRKVDDNFVKCRQTIEEIFSSDEDGIVSMEAVSLLAKMMKAKDFQVHDSVLDTFLHLRLLSEFSSKGSKDSIDKQSDEQNTYKGKRLKQKREFRTKKERKILKERKVVEKDLKEADALVSHEQRDKMQAETLKLVFGTYFRILKLRSPNLMGAVLEGLAKYAHLINQDFFGDLLEALKELIAQTQPSDDDDEDNASDNETDTTPFKHTTRNTTRESLLCSITAFALLDGQDASKAASTLHLDLSYFITNLYQTLYPLSLNPDIEYNPSKSLRLPDPSTPNNPTPQTQTQKVNFQTPTVLLLHCLNSTLLSKGAHSPPPLRLAGFSKRLMTTTLHLPEKSAQATLALLGRVAKAHGRKIAPLWNTEERKGDGVFVGDAGTVEGANVFAGTVWEGELLRLHYCPGVREGVKGLEGVVGGVK
ncbi:hypothetical protein FQN50_008425 [Emmonsiellopsis sp. PD_5]|nr:hypothetical protein FQN50_008425 [Emmonsiellopsis sp. PD_5]